MKIYEKKSLKMWQRKTEMKATEFYSVINKRVI